MHDPAKSQNSGYDFAYFSSDCDILEIREQDTKPGGKLNERSRKLLEQKYARKTPPPKPRLPNE
jgi:hypothetical protein